MILDTVKTCFSDEHKAHEIALTNMMDDPDWDYIVEPLGKYFVIGVYDLDGLIGYL
jgi:hypothetical protein